MSAASAVATNAAIRNPKPVIKKRSRRIKLLGSLTHYFNDDAFGPLSVELGVIHLLPGSEVEAPVRHRNDHLMMNQQTFQVRIAVGLAGAVMPIIVAVRRQLLQPLIDVGQQSVF